MSLVENAKKTLSAFLKDDKAEGDKVTLFIPEKNLEISTWMSYEFSSDFLDPCASWTCEIADDNYQNLAVALQNCTKVVFYINDQIQATGYLDQFGIQSSTAGGTILHLSGRDCMAPACDATMDPKFEFPAGGTIKSLMEKIFIGDGKNSFGFGFKQVKVDDIINRQKLTGSASHFGVNEDHKVVEEAITVPINNKFKPHAHEGVYEFAERIGKRYGFHIWASADGDTCYISRPSFKQDPAYSLFHKTAEAGNINNVISSNVVFSTHEQPEVVVAEGSGGGGHFRKQSLKVLKVNELMSDSDDQIPNFAQLKKNYSEAKVSPRNANLKKPPQIQTQTKFIRVAYPYDDESKSIAQLENFVARYMAEHQWKACQAHYTVNEHSYLGVAWAPNTMVKVVDEVSGLNQVMWIKARKFRKSMQGTFTDLELILPYSLQIYPSGDSS